MAKAHSFSDLDSSEKKGAFILIDKIDLDDKKPLSKCRCYGIGWYDNDDNPQCWSCPDKDIACYPIGRYIKVLVKEALESDMNNPAK